MEIVLAKSSTATTLIDLVYPEVTLLSTSLTDKSFIVKVPVKKAHT